MLARLNIAPNARLKTLSKGNKEKVQLVLAMSRNARLYLLDEPIGGVDPATRDACVNAGANVLVAGSAVYKAADIPAKIKALREG